MKLNEKFRSCFIVTLIAVTLLSFTTCCKDHHKLYVREYSKEDSLFLQKFREHCRELDRKVDSTNNVINKDYNYHYSITVKCLDNLPNIYQSLPYYGMTNGYQAFLYNFFRKEVIEVSLFYLGDGNKYLAIGDFYINEVRVNMAKGSKYKYLSEANIAEYEAKYGKSYYTESRNICTCFTDYNSERNSLFCKCYRPR